jgi:hypothetical protein
MVACSVLGMSALLSWALPAWHWLGRGKPLRLAPLVKCLRR